jgi:octaprenyl-diphosphate synthase
MGQITQFNEYYSLIEEAIGLSLQKMDSSSPLSAPIRDLLSRGGKRWRPLFLLLTGEALACKRVELLPLASLLELSHSASLIHDDIEDRSPQRRGKASLHILYGEDVAINAGSYLYFLAGQSVEKLEPRIQAQVYRLWLDTMRKIHEGQALDISWHNEAPQSHIPTEEEYSRMCRYKTGALVALAVHLAYTLAGKEAPEELLDAAANLGLAFQIIDDVKNLRGEISGKSAADDLEEGKRSLPLIYFLQDAAGERDSRMACLMENLGVAREKRTEVGLHLIEEMERSGAIGRAADRGKELLEGSRRVFSEAASSKLLSLIDSLA